MPPLRWPPAKLYFHLLLAAFVCPLLEVPIAWGLVLANRASQPAEAAVPEQRLWSHRLRWLALADTLLLVLLVATFGASGWNTLGGPVATTPPNRVIGILLDPQAPRPTVKEVEPGFPAERAGVKPGDVLLAVNGKPVATASEARQAISSTPAAEDARLELQRGPKRLELSIPLVSAAEENRAQYRGLFEPLTSECTPLRPSGIPWGLLFVATASLVLFLVGRRRGANAALVQVAGLLFVIAAITEVVAVGACHALGGTSRGGLLLSLLAQTVLVLGAGLLLRPRVPVIPQPEDRRWWRKALLGALYMFGGGIRVGVLLLSLVRLAGAEAASPFQTSPIHELGASGLGVWGALLFLLPVAIIGPIGEEFLFRGVVLPWLWGWLGERWALGLSALLFAALHLYYGPFVGVIFVYGLVLGWARLRSGTLKTSIVLHMGLNSLASAVLFFTSS